MMRLSDLIGVEVRAQSGAKAGRVTDVRLEGGPPVVPATGQPTWRLTGLVVGGRGFAYRLGYVQDEVRGPWLLKLLLRPFLGRPQLVPWHRVRAITESGIVIEASPEDLADADELGEVT